MKKEVLCIVGLGNPGPQYEFTRHNVGFMVLDALSRKHGVGWTTMPGHTRHAKVLVGQRQVLLICPLTFMNLSGQAVRDVTHRTELSPEEILIVHDDLDLSLGRLKIVKGGGAGGHRGVSSILASLETEEVPRLKVGIGRPKHGEEISDFVLSPFYQDEFELLERVMEKAVWACELVLLEGLERAMSKVNCLNLRSKEE